MKVDDNGWWKAVDDNDGQWWIEMKHKWWIMVGNGSYIVMEHDGWGWKMIIDNETYFTDSEPNTAIVTTDTG